MEQFPVDQYLVDEVLKAIEILTMPLEPGKVERLNPQQQADLYEAIQRLVNWIESH